MNRTPINNCLDSCPLEIGSRVQAPFGPLVTLFQNSGSIHLQHDMTPDQARTMALELMRHAAGVDAEIEATP